MVRVGDGRAERAWGYGVEWIDTTALIDKPVPQRAVGGVYFSFGYEEEVPLFRKTARIKPTLPLYI